MAFIRWKKNAAGNRQAYLVQSYRDENGKPRHKMLAYLGEAGSLTPEKLTALQGQYPDLQVDWDKIKSAERPRTDISTLSDTELLQRIRHLRHELSFNQQRMVWRLEELGMPRCTGPYGVGRGMGSREWGVLEKALESNEPQDFYLNPETEIAPALRKALSSNP